MRRFLLSGTLLTLVAGVVLAGQQAGQPEGAQPQRPTFRAQIDYVEVSAIVTDDDGNLVKDLKATDFQIFENGQPQTVSVFTPVTIPVERFERTLVDGKPLSYDVMTNEGIRDGRVYVIVLDDYHVGPMRASQVKVAAKKFIEEYVAPNDMVAVIHASGRSNASQEFTTNKDLMIASIDRFIGMKLRSSTLERLDQYRLTQDTRCRPVDGNQDGNVQGDQCDRLLDMLDPERAYFARSSMETLRNTSRLLDTVNGRRKAVLYFSEGIDYNTVDVMGEVARFATDVLYAMRDAIGAATRSNVAYYAIDPRGLVGMSDDEMDMDAPPQNPTLNLNPWNVRDEQRLAQNALRSLAESTGGYASVNSNDFSTAFERVVRDSSNYYLLGYYPTDTRRDGRVRRIEVKVNRPNTKVFARKAYVAPKDREEKRTEESASGTSAELRAVLNAALPTPGLGVSVHTANFRGAGPKSSVMVTVQIDGTSLQFQKEGDTFNNKLEISMMALDTSGKIQGGDRTQLDLKLRDQTRQLVEQTGFRSVLQLELPAGRYQLRVAARELNGGALGSVFNDLVVPDFAKERFSMSGVLLTSTSAGLTPTPRLPEELKQMLPAPPTTIRGFGNRETIYGYVDVYDGVTPAHTVDITTTVTGTAGTQVFSTTQERASSEFTGPRGGYGVQFEIPLQDVAPGLYVLKVEAKPRLAKVDAVSRELTFAVFGPAAATAAADAPQMVPVAHGPLSNRASSEELVVRSADDWARVWQSLPTKQNAPSVAFDETMMVGVFVGNRPTAGYRVEVAGVRLDGDTLVVSWREVPPAAGATVSQTVTTPFALAAVTRHDGPVRFEKLQ
jgi:VWFA-related protein